jgi:hypothetical protein
MLALALVLIGIGLIVCFVSGIWSLVVAFQRHVLWGLAYLLVPFASLVFLFVAWAEAKKPFLIGLVGLLIATIGVFFVPKQSVQQLSAMVAGGAPVEFDMEAAGLGGVQQVAHTAPALDVQQRLATLRLREADLLARKSAVDPKNAAAVAAIDAEIRAYNAELQPLLQQLSN